MNDLLEQTWVYRDGEPRWLVSTLDRPSSSPLAAGMIYAETIVWEFEEGFTADGSRRRRLVGQTDAPMGSLFGHDMMVRRLRATGSPNDPDDE